MLRLNALFTLVLTTGVTAAAPTENIYAWLQKGDWVEFKTTNGAKETVISRQTVLDKNDKEITLKLESSINGKSSEPLEQKINIQTPTDPEEVLKNLKGIKATLETLGTGKESLTIAGKTYDCRWEKKKTTFMYDNPMIPTTEFITKSWRSSDVPFGGTVKIETTMSGVTSVTELAGFGKGK